MTSTQTEDAAPPRLESLPLARLAGGDNPRHGVDTDSEAFAGLLDSVRQQGVVQPILVGPADAEHDNRYPIIAGNRRVEAAMQAGLEEIPAMIVDRPGAEFILAVTENVQREDLTAVEEAEALERLRRAPFNLKQAEAAQALGKSERWARERLRLLNLPPDVRQAMNERLIPLEASVHLERVAKGSARVADILAAEVREDPELGRDLVDGNVVADRVRKVAAKAGLQAISTGHVYDPGTALEQLPISDTDRERLAPLVEEIPVQPQTGRRAGFRFGQADADAAKAFGCLLEIPTDRHGFKETHRYITDAEWLASQVESKIPTMKAEATKAAKEAADRGAAAPKPTEADAKAAAKLERKADKARDTNASLRMKLMAMKVPKVDVEAVRLMAVLSLGWVDDLDYRVEQAFGATDARYRMEVDGEQKPEGEWPGDVLLREIVEAKTAGAIFRAVFRIYAVETLQLVENPRDARAGELHHGDHFDWRLDELGVDVDELVASIAGDLALLPEPISKALDRHRTGKVKERDERAKARAEAEAEAAAKGEGGEDDG